MKVTLVIQTNARDHELSTFWIDVASRIHWFSYSHLVPNDHCCWALFDDVGQDYQLAVVVIVAWILTWYCLKMILVTVEQL